MVFLILPAFETGDHNIRLFTLTVAEFLWMLLLLCCLARLSFLSLNTQKEILIINLNLKNMPWELAISIGLTTIQVVLAILSVHAESCLLA